MTRLALFDLDDTLVDSIPAYKRWTERFAAGRELSSADLAVLHDVGEYQVDLKQQLQRIHTHFAPAEGFDEFWAGFRDGYPRYVRCRPATLKGLKRLREAGWTIGIVTNGRTRNQTDKITFSGLDRHVEAWAISEAEGMTKPDVGIFEAISRRLGVPLSNGGWMVGDNQGADVAGGAGAGLSTIWLRHGRTVDPDLASPSRSCDSVTEAIDLMLT